MKISHAAALDRMLNPPLRLDDPTLRYDDDVLVTKTDARTVVRIPTQPATFASADALKDLGWAATMSLAALRSGELVIRSVHVPMDPSEDARLYDARVRRQAEPSPSWGENLVGQQKRSMLQAPTRKQVYLEASLGRRSLVDQWRKAPEPFAPISKRETERWAAKASLVRERLARGGFAGRPVGVDELAWLRRRAVGRVQHGGGPYAAAHKNVWQRGDVVDEFADFSGAITQGPNYVRIITPSGHARFVATFVVSSMPTEMFFPSVDPWLAHLDRLSELDPASGRLRSFDVDADLLLTLTPPAQAAKEMKTRTAVVTDQRNEAEKARADLPVEVGQMFALARELEYVIPTRQMPSASGWARIRVEAGSPEQLRRRFEAVREHMKSIGGSGIDVVWPEGTAQGALWAEGCPGSPVRHRSWQQRWMLETVGCALPHAGSTFGHRGGAYYGFTTGQQRKAVRLNFHHAITDQGPDAVETAGGVALLGAPRAGKALAVDTPVATPTGWSTMGELARGDRVLGADGQPVTVTDAWAVRHDRPCFEVTFSDGAKIVADAEHQWLTRVAGAEPSVVTTRGLALGHTIHLAHGFDPSGLARQQQTPPLVRSVVAVTPVASVPVRCIAVDAADHLFLAGDALIPTHNSGALGAVIDEGTEAGIPIVALEPPGRLAKLAELPRHAGRIDAFDLLDVGGGAVDPMGRTLIPDPVYVRPVNSSHRARVEADRINARALNVVQVERERLTVETVMTVAWDMLHGPGNPLAEVTRCVRRVARSSAGESSMAALIADFEGSKTKAVADLGSYLNFYLLDGLEGDGGAGRALVGGGTESADAVLPVTAAASTRIISFASLVLPSGDKPVHLWKPEEQLSAAVFGCGTYLARRMLLSMDPNLLKYLAVDEAHVLFPVPAGYRVIDESLRHGPKNGIITFLSTHNATDMADDAIRDKIATWMLFRTLSAQEMSMSHQAANLVDSVENRAVRRGLLNGECITVLDTGAVDRWRWDQWKVGQAQALKTTSTGTAAGSAGEPVAESASAPASASASADAGGDHGPADGSAVGGPVSLDKAGWGARGRDDLDGALAASGVVDVSVGAGVSGSSSAASREDLLASANGNAL